ncbi:MAG: TolC family protein [Desulfobacteraceae bacterium]|nr:TolC family protein [Pseudomonadota bacterium]NQU14877.1 TolC family protein [Desulfobacteraceae bacterium]
MGHSVTKLVIFMIVALGLAGITGRPLEAASHLWVNPALSQLIEEGLTNNKEIQSFAARVESLKEEIPFAGSLEDPRLGIAILNLPTDTFSFDQEAMTQKQLFIAQKVPWFGKLSLREQRQTLIASRQQALLEAKRFELVRKIATSYYELGFIAKSLEINERLTDMVNQLIRVAETRYASGRGLQQDVLQAQVELSKLLDERITLGKKRRTIEDQINELLNRESFIAVPPPKDLPYPGLRLEIESLQAQSLRKNPLLRVRQTEVDQASVEIELAKKDYWPDMDFKLAYGQREEDFTGRDLPDFVSGSVVINVPLWHKKRQDRNLASKQKNSEAAARFYQNLVQSLPHRVDALVTEIRETQENYRLFSDALMLQAEQWASSSLSAYVVDKVEFNTMINAHIRLLRFELQTDRYLFNIYQKRAELEEILGGPLEP